MEEETTGVAGGTRVLVSGCMGKMGTEIVKAVHAAHDLTLAGGYDPLAGKGSILIDGSEVAPAFTDLSVALAEVKPDVLIDFTMPSAAPDNLALALAEGVSCVLGTSGVPTAKLEELIATAPEGTALFVAPNFTTGAVLMMMLSKLAAPYFEDIEIFEFHHNNKKDSPSGTAVATAEMMADARMGTEVMSTAPGSETELAAYPGARGSEYQESGIRIHSVRTNGYMATQEILYGSPGQRMTIRHDTFDRNSYMPGILLALRKVKSLSGLVIGLEELMEL